MKSKFYITTSIAYTNSDPHLGFALEITQADVLARYRKTLGEEVFFLTGTDEHGVKIVKSAEQANKNPKEFVDEISGKFQKLAKEINLSNNDFIRTSDQKKHWPTVKKVWLQLEKNNDLYKKKYQGLYCPGCEAFITKKDLVDGKCVNHRREPEVIEEENYFFRLSKYSKQIEKLIKNNAIKIIPPSKKKDVLNFIGQGLEDLSFSRPRIDLQWGIPVPNDNTQTIYVWSDALLNYISALGYDKNSPKYKKFWPADIHCIGKDILKFHAAIFPGMLLALKLPLPKNIFVHGFITVNGQKMSKTLGNVINPFDLIKTYGADSLRYYLLRELPASEDGDFSMEKFTNRHNGDLANGLGNFSARTLSLASKSTFKINSKTLKSNNASINKKIELTRKKVGQKIEQFKFNEALNAIWDLISFGDNYVNKNKIWAIKDEKIKSQKILDLVVILKNTAEMLAPFLPATSEKILKNIKISKNILKTTKGEILFPRI